MRRTRAWRRYKNYTKAKRKREIDRAVSHYFYEWFGHGFYDNLHEYSKNKIHCSCPDCSPKTRNKGKRRALAGNYSPSINYKISDKKKKEKLDFQLKDFDFS